MKSRTTYRSDNSHGQRDFINNLRSSFTERERSAKRLVRQRHKRYLDFLNRRGISLENLREAPAHKVAAGALATAMAFAPMSTVDIQAVSNPALGQAGSVLAVEDPGFKLSAELKKVIPDGYQNLSREQEDKVSFVIADVLNVRAVAEIGGKRLNRNFGLIGAEQHLYRYPGDNIFQHAQTPTEFAMFGGSGIAPGLGAYGYWTRSKESLTQEMILQEKWYVVAQTFLSPGFKEDPRGTVNFFRYRKFLVINPDSGAAVVGDLADAGPAEFTGKSFGGSPEVMHALGYGGGPRKGRVVFFFLDDPQNKIPLGPIGGRL